MIRNHDGGEVSVYCDGEDCVGVVEGLDFDEAIELAKREGWKIMKLDTGWNHLCPECQNQEDE